MKLTKVKLSAIRPYERNPRRNDKAAEEVAKSIEQVGYCNPIIVDEDMVVLAGHTRLKALKKLGWKECDVIIRGGLTEEQKKKYRLYDNKTGELAEWDFELLAQEMEGLDFSAFDIDWGMQAEFDEPEEREFSDDESDDEEYDYECPVCGFLFNKGQAGKW